MVPALWLCGARSPCASHCLKLFKKGGSIFLATAVSSRLWGPFSMSWSGQFQFPVPLFDLSCCPWPLAFACLLNQWTFLETIAEGRVTGNRNLATLSLPLHQEIHRLPCLL